MEQRTSQQNKAIHTYFTLLAEELNSAGLDMRIVLKPSYQIWWTPESIKENIWKPVQEAMYKKQSTTELTKKEIDKVYEQINQLLAEKWGVSVPFPSNQPPLLEEI